MRTVHVGLQVGDLERSLACYEALGCEVVGHVPETGFGRVIQGAADVDLELLEHRALDEHIQELVYRPVVH